jgi:GNAT superfamily N-acetyltransferase
MDLNRLIIRPIDPDDSIEDLTLLIRRAYQQLADIGLRYLATHQDADTTRKRIKNAECFVAEYESKIIGTITYNPPKKTSGTPWYGRPGIAHFQQFAVEPELQKRRIGTKMMEFIEKHAKNGGAEELALDTSEKAVHLIEWYTKMGYRFIEFADWDITNYRSIILSKKL